MKTILNCWVAVLASLLSASDTAAQQIALEGYHYEFTVDLWGGYQGNDHGKSYSGSFSGPTNYSTTEDDLSGNGYDVTIGSKDTLRIAYGLKLVHDPITKEVLEVIVESSDRPIIFDVRAERVTLSTGVLTFRPKILLGWEGLHGRMVSSGHYYEEYIERAVVIDSLPRVLTLSFAEVRSSVDVSDVLPARGIMQAGNSLRFSSRDRSEILNIYDRLGRNVDQIPVQQGVTELAIPANLGSGVYFAQLGNASCKMLIQP